MRNVIKAVLLVSVALIPASVHAQTPAPATQPIIEVSPADASIGQGKVVGMDYFYNHQVKNGKQFHYIWDDTAASGYSRWGDVWKQYGATIAKLEKAPASDDLAKFSVYIVENPATAAKAAPNAPNYIEEPAISTIYDWVNGGGVLMLLANDKNNCEFEHFNNLCKRFGIVFNGDLRNEVPTARDADRKNGCFDTSVFPKDCPLFDGVSLIYMKEISTITVNPPAQVLMTAPKQHGEQGTDVIMATAKVGKGFVYAVGDPWVYNEYIDVHTPGLPIQNRKAGMNLAKWMLTQAQAPTAKP